MDKKAKIKKQTAVKKGAFCVPVKSDMPSANKPDIIATAEFRVVMVPKISFRDPPASSRR